MTIDRFQIRANQLLDHFRKLQTDMDVSNQSDESIKSMEDFLVALGGEDLYVIELIFYMADNSR